MHIIFPAYSSEQVSDLSKEGSDILKSLLLVADIDGLEQDARSNKRTSG
jgi:hypothetical protein